MYSITLSSNMTVKLSISSMPNIHFLPITSLHYNHNVASTQYLCILSKDRKKQRNNNNPFQYNLFIYLRHIQLYWRTDIYIIVTNTFSVYCVTRQKMFKIKIKHHSNLSTSFTDEMWTDRHDIPIMHSF
jgi:hypothetical protein